MEGYICSKSHSESGDDRTGLSGSGIDIPGAVAVIGCDDFPLAQFSVPSLTTLTRREEAKQQILELRINNILAASRDAPVEEELPVQLSLVIRESA